MKKMKNEWSKIKLTKKNEKEKELLFFSRERERAMLSWQRCLLYDNSAILGK